MNYIKTIHKSARQRGTTLIELSVVIAVILLLVGVLFIGVQAWRDGANRSACLVNMSTIQKSVRGYQNLNNLNIGDPLTVADLTSPPPTGGDPMLAAMPVCPVGGKAYTPFGAVPPTGTPYAACAATGNSSVPHTMTTAQTANW
jgi:prepilin-type N-terminal cleavage/methylation domain-containing protein